jgi:hypothetical protein
MVTTSMKFSEFENALSAPRLGRYLRACSGDTRKALTLYRYNIKLGQSFYGVIGVLEVALRTAINEHFKTSLADADWIITQANDGFLRKYKDAIKKERSRLDLTGSYTNDRLLSSLSFGVWTFLFSRKCYRSSGKTLLRIFPNKPHGTNQSDVYKELDTIRHFRNRIAHYEPACFNRQGAIDVSHAEEVFRLIVGFLDYLGFSSKEILYGVETPEKVFSSIKNLSAI